MLNTLEPIGHKFWHVTFEGSYSDACINCGRLRKKGKTDYSWDSEQYCGKCGKSYRGKSEKVIKPLYVIGHYKQWDGKEGYMLSETKVDDLDENRKNGKGFSYWSYLAEELGSRYFNTNTEETEDE